MTASQNPAKVLLYFVSEDWYFYSHRLDLAKAALAAGYEVVLVTNVSRHAEAIQQAGVRVVPLKVWRQTVNPLQLLKSIFQLVAIYRRIKPTLVHHVALFPVVIGGFAARLAGVRAVVNTVPGLGFVFASTQMKARLLRPLLQFALQRVLRDPRQVLIVQNVDDHAWAIQMVTDPTRVHLIKGSGVDVKRYMPSVEPDGTPVVLMAARMLWDKGVGDFVDAARRLKHEGVKARFVLAGDVDPGNPGSVSREQLDAWKGEGTVEWIGFQADMATAIGNSHIACLPTSYGEGVPKFLIEAAACARPIVATRVPGCKEIVQDDVNGLLVPAHAPEALAQALRVLLLDKSLRITMGATGRNMVETEFALDIVNWATLHCYELALLGAGYDVTEHSTAKRAIQPH